MTTRIQAMPRMPYQRKSKSVSIRVIDGRGIAKNENGGGELHLPIGYLFLEDWERSWFVAGDANDDTKGAARLENKSRYYYKRGRNDCLDECRIQGAGS
jgi:hypothetical protein